MAESTVVVATGMATRKRKSGLGQAIQVAMNKAILDCNAAGIATSGETDGVSNASIIQRAMMDARERVRQEWENKP